MASLNARWDRGVDRVGNGEKGLDWLNELGRGQHSEVVEQRM